MKVGVGRVLVAAESGLELEPGPVVGAAVGAAVVAGFGPAVVVVVW